MKTETAKTHIFLDSNRISKIDWTKAVTVLTFEPPLCWNQQHWSSCTMWQTRAQNDHKVLRNWKIYPKAGGSFEVVWHTVQKGRQPIAGSGQSSHLPLQTFTCQAVFCCLFFFGNDQSMVSEIFPKAPPRDRIPTTKLCSQNHLANNQSCAGLQLHTLGSNHNRSHRLQSLDGGLEVPPNCSPCRIPNPRCTCFRASGLGILLLIHVGAKNHRCHLSGMMMNDDSRNTIRI